MGKGLKIILIALLTLALGFASAAPSPAFAQGEGISMIRDAEIEHYLRTLAAPIYRAADIDPDSVSIFIVNSNVVNAFVAEGMNEFFYTGLLLLTDSPEQLAGVIAHETGHIAGGHLIRGREAMGNASAEAILGMLLGLAAGIASGNGQVAMGAISGSQQIAERNMLSFSRSVESSADSAAMSYLDRAGMTSNGMEEFMKKLGAQDLLPVDRQVQYVRTHPLTQDRIDAVGHHLEHSSYAKAKLDPKFAVMHERMKAKLLGYLQPQMALLRYTDKDPRLPARYARAIALYQTSQLPRALALTDGLIKEEPKNPFFIELKAQMLFENSQVDEAVTHYRKALDLLPDSALLRLEYARALLESNHPETLDEVIRQLTEANRKEPHDPEIWRLLASAWGQKNEITKDAKYGGYASYALAEESAARGADREAKQFADRALKVLPKGSPYWLRAQDIKLSTEDDSHR
ncbi:MAG: M48 family metalloprotease [Alphaproteobacteria bacterium]|nr:M48 family metalloprotease [Alphaproteobacteria bacterium]